MKEVLANYLSDAELKALDKKQPLEGPMRLMVQTFRDMDKDGSGFIEKNEFDGGLISDSGQKGYSNGEPDAFYNQYMRRLLTQAASPPDPRTIDHSHTPTSH
eukprot:c9824_g1_i1.p1 GENE.c9824_g1_i1~~c9824_g1_i1.p1  ORF type:complete len:102 (+),score=22.26 c9824_g1_i1:301-606(+)